MSGVTLCFVVIAAVIVLAALIFLIFQPEISRGRRVAKALKEFLEDERKFFLAVSGLTDFICEDFFGDSQKKVSCSVSEIKSATEGLGKEDSDDEALLLKIVNEKFEIARCVLDALEKHEEFVKQEKSRGLAVAIYKDQNVAFGNAIEKISEALAG